MTSSAPFSYTSGGNILGAAGYGSSTFTESGGTLSVNPSNYNPCSVGGSGKSLATSMGTYGGQKSRGRGKGRGKGRSRSRGRGKGKSRAKGKGKGKGKTSKLRKLRKTRGSRKAHRR
jgi:hypothetical protein